MPWGRGTGCNRSAYVVAWQIHPAYALTQSVVEMAEKRRSVETFNRPEL
jgi:hypothetical protein